MEKIFTKNTCTCMITVMKQNETATVVSLKTFSSYNNVVV